MVYFPVETAHTWNISPATRVCYMAWQPGEGEVVAIATDKGGRILDLEKPETQVIKFGADTDMVCLAWSPGGDRLATLEKDVGDRVLEGEVVIWNSSGFKIVSLQKEYPNDYLGQPIKFNPSGEMLVVRKTNFRRNFGGLYGFNVFDAHTGHCLRFLKTNKSNEPTAIVWKNELEVFIPLGGNVIHWHAAQGKQLQVLSGPKSSYRSAITSLAFNPMSGVLAAGLDHSDFSGAQLWNTGEANPSTTTLKSHPFIVNEVIWHPLNPRILASFDSNGVVELWDIDKKVTLHSFRVPRLHQSTYLNKMISFSPDGRHLSVVGEDEVEVRAVNSGEIEAVCKLDRAEMASWSPKGDKLAVQSFSSESMFDLLNVVGMKLEVLSLKRVASCLKNNISNKDEDIEDVLKKLPIPEKIIPKVRQYLN